VIAQPIAGMEHTREDPSIASHAQRWKHYCQDDHLRRYGRRDFFARPTQAGLRVNRLDTAQLGAERFRHVALQENYAAYGVERGYRVGRTGDCWRAALPCAPPARTSRGR
jgi:hypothetical protein